MPNIDLTPKSLKANQCRKKRFVIWVILLIMVLLGNAGWLGYRYVINLKINDDYVLAMNEYQTIQNNMQQLIKARSQLEQWQDRIVLFDKMGRYFDYVFILKYLSDYTPELLVLTDIKFMRPKKDDEMDDFYEQPKLPPAASMFLVNQPGQEQKSEKNDLVEIDNSMVMTIQGNALDYDIVADYIEMLRNSKLFVKTKLVNSKRSEQKNQSVDFEIECFLSVLSIPDRLENADITKTKNF